VAERALWDKYMAAYETVITATQRDANAEARRKLEAEA
jgi:hypothetical protein